VPVRSTKQNGSGKRNGDSPHGTKKRPRPHLPSAIHKRAGKQLAPHDCRDCRGRQKDNRDGGHDLHDVGVLDESDGISRGEKVEREPNGVRESAVQTLEPELGGTEQGLPVEQQVSELLASAVGPRRVLTGLGLRPCKCVRGLEAEEDAFAEEETRLDRLAEMGDVLRHVLKLSKGEFSFRCVLSRSGSR